MLWDGWESHEVWDTEPFGNDARISTQACLAPTRPEDESFWRGDHEVEVGYFTLTGYVSDPQLSCHNLQRGAGARGATFQFNARVLSVDQANGRVVGVTLDDGSTPGAVVINVAGPRSYRQPVGWRL